MLIKMNENYMQELITKALIDSGLGEDVAKTSAAIAIKTLGEHRLAEHADMIEMAKRIGTAGGYIDNHNMGYKNENKLCQDAGAVVLLQKGELGLWHGARSCINHCYIDSTGIPHLSTYSNGGTVYRGARAPLQQDIDYYNDGLTLKSCRIVDFVPIDYSISDTAKAKELEDAWKFFFNEDDVEPTDDGMPTE